MTAWRNSVFENASNILLTKGDFKIGTASACYLTLAVTQSVSQTIKTFNNEE